ncbi:MAG: SDR family NAD(P)-dependent oxidoreductase [Nocardioides sp.]|uniref:SDR family NAD(P)-dependent oxidoreductase n=1 Tax=Nocardioides sp. TaxID=35761 RepID=UPI0039E2319A
MRLSGGVALVTGASAGIGEATAHRLAAAGATVLVHGRDPERTRAVAAAVDGTPLVVDLSAPDAAETLADRALAAAGRIDVLVVSAGRGHSGLFTAMDPALVEEILAVDLAAAVGLTRRVLPGMIERGSGHLCFVTSIAGRTGVAGEAVYAAAKAGLDAFAESLRLELTGSGVSVSVVVPAVVDTGFFDRRGEPYRRRSPRPIPADRAAAAILRAVSRERAEVYLPAWTRIAPTVRALAPGPFRALSRRFGEPVRSRR